MLFPHGRRADAVALETTNHFSKFSFWCSQRRKSFASFWFLEYVMTPCEWLR
jgi:hypothetical protein